MAPNQRARLERYAEGSKPLNAAIKAALQRIDDLEKRLAVDVNCPSCDGRGMRWYPTYGLQCCVKCRGTGKCPGGGEC